MHVYKSPQSKETGIGYVRFHSNFWCHVDCNDRDSEPRQVGPVYNSKADLLADHIPYLLRAGWHKIEVIQPEPRFISRATIHGVVFAFEMDDGITGIRVLGNGKLEATERYIQAIEDEYGNAVKIITPSTKHHPQRMFATIN